MSDPKSASYGQYLTPQQFRQRFAPSQGNVGAVTSWLQSQGFTIAYVPQNNHYIAAEGTVAQAATAFGTTFGHYTTQGMRLRSPETAPSIPAALGGIVTSVVGLDQTFALVHTNMSRDPDARPRRAFVNPSPPLCSAYWGENLATGLPEPVRRRRWPYARVATSPEQIRAAYGVPAGFDGGRADRGHHRRVRVADDPG